MKFNFQRIFLSIVVLSALSSCSENVQNIKTISIYIILIFLLIGVLWFIRWKTKRAKSENASITRFNKNIQNILAKLETPEEKINALLFALERVQNNEEYSKNKPWRNSLLITIYLHLTVAYNQQGNDDMILQTCDDILELNPKHALTYYNRGYIYYKKNKNKKALSDLDQYLKLDAKDKWGLSSEVKALIDEIKQKI